MAALRKHARDFYEWISHRSTQVSAYIPIEDTHVQRNTDNNGANAPFEAEKHYFRAVISEMFLSNSRQWFREYSPLVYSAVEFNYGTLQQEEPKVVGPALLGQGQQAPQGTLYLDTPISGLHPYRGGDFTFTVILYRCRYSDHLADIIKMVENVVGIVNPSVALAGYIGMAKVIVDGLDMILGTRQIDPIIGVRKTLGLGSEFRAGYHVLIDAPDSSVKKEELWVRGGRLYIGTSLENAVPYRENDFVLFQILQTEERDDINLLPFFPLWEETQKQVVNPKSWKEAKNTFAMLYRNLLLSHDLTDAQKEKLRLTYNEKFKQLREHGREQAHLGVAREEHETKLSFMQERLEELDSLFGELD